MEQTIKGLISGMEKYREPRYIKNKGGIVFLLKENDTSFLQKINMEAISNE